MEASFTFSSATPKFGMCRLPKEKKGLFRCLRNDTKTNPIKDETRREKKKNTSNPPNKVDVPPKNVCGDFYIFSN